MRRALSAVLVIFAFGCGAQLPDDADSTSFEAGSAEEAAVLAVANDPQVTMTVLDIDVALDRRAAEGIVTHRAGADGTFETGDDDLFDTIDELDAVSYVGPVALGNLLDYAIANGYYDTGDDSAWMRERAILAVVNTVDHYTLDEEVRLDRRAADHIIEYRDGVDGIAGTFDDRVIMSLPELDALSYVGNRAIGKLFDYALDNGYTTLAWDAEIDAVFSPQPYSESHNVRVRDLINQADTSIDIAMYSFSDQGIYDALEAAAARGVKVRFVFDTASEDRKLTGAELEASKSARLEKMGINVRWINKIMHHKYIIVDGPRDDAAAADTAHVATGSGNWSYGAATIYDENTVFFTGLPELTLELQREFNLMWEHSHDFVWDDTLPYELSTLVIDDSMLPSEPWTEAHFTSANFNVSGDTFSITSANHVSDAMADAIDHATDSIYIASGHLRSRPIAEALIAKAQAMPEIDIRIYLDGQEYISEWYHQQQLDDLADCMAAATTANQERKCMESGFHFGYQVGELAQIPLRYKYYSYRWHYKSARQMHHKLMIIDGDELWTGSYNLSNNAERNTFENMLVYRGWQMAPVIRAYQKNFKTLWSTHVGDGTYESLLDDVENADDIPLIFEPMALDWQQIRDLKDAIADNCSQINSEAYRTEPWKYSTCPR